MNESQESQLWFFCAAAGHTEGCDTWPEHRRRMQERYDIIEAQLKYLDDIRKSGKASQGAAARGQVSVTGQAFPEPIVTEPVLDENEPVVVEWGSTSLGIRDGVEYPFCWITSDKRIGPFRPLQGKEDARRASIEAYKPRKVEIYFDGKPDEWNGYR